MAQRIERNIRQLPNGTYEIRVHVSRNRRTGKVRQVSRTTDKGIRTARAIRSKLEHEAKQGKFGGVRSTLGFLLDDWNQQREEMGRSPTTLHEDRRKIDTVIRPALGDVTLDRLTTRMVDAFYAKLVSDGVKPNTVMKYHRILHAALQQALKWEWVPTNVATLASPPKMVSRVFPVPTPEEVQRIITAAGKGRNPEYAGLITVAALSGMRQGELCALRFSDVDLDGARINVRSSQWQVGKKSGIKDPKSHQQRTLQVDALAIEVVRYRWARLETAAAGAGIEPDPDAFVWSMDELGRVPYRPKSVASAFPHICERAKVKCRFHDLRKYSGTELIAAGFDPRTVADRLGHADPAFTMRVYIASREQRDQDAAMALGNTLRPVGRPALPKGD